MNTAGTARSIGVGTYCDSLDKTKMHKLITWFLRLDPISTFVRQHDLHTQILHLQPSFRGLVLEELGWKEKW